MHNRGSAHTTPVAVEAPARHLASLAAALAAGAPHPGIQRCESGVRGQSDACREHSDGGRLGAVNLNEQRWRSRAGALRASVTSASSAGIGERPPAKQTLAVAPFHKSRERGRLREDDPLEGPRSCSPQLSRTEAPAGPRVRRFSESHTPPPGAPASSAGQCSGHLRRFRPRTMPCHFSLSTSSFSVLR